MANGKPYLESFPISTHNILENTDFLISFYIDAKKGKKYIYKLYPDDCILSVKINENMFPQKRIKEACAYHNGTELNFSEFLREGSNKIDIQMRNYGGPGGLRVEKSNKSPNQLTFMHYVFALLFLLAFVLILRKVKLNLATILIILSSMKKKLLSTRFIVYARKYNHKIMFAIILLFAIMLRLYDFGVTPASIHQDEAMMAYDAYADIFYGMDINGDHNPVYSVSWGSGQNMGYNYVLRPFIKIFGLNIVTVRLPMLIFSIISLFFFYLLLSRLFGSNVGLLGFFLLALNPWHIMISRWALEGNFAPLIFLPAIYFAVISREKPAFFILSMFLFGFSCYGYGTVLMLCIAFIPLMIWHVFRHKVVPVKYAILGFLTFGLVSGPLAIYLFINYFDFPAFNLFGLSITRTTVMRYSSTTSFDIIEQLTHFLRFLLTWNDRWIGDAIPEFGALYPFMLPFILFGAYVLFVKHRGKAFEIKIWLISAILLTMVVHIMIHRINMIFFPLICLATLGVAEIHRFAKFVVPIFASLVIIMTIGFANIYFKEYNEMSQWAYFNKFDKAIEYAVQNSHPSATIYFGNVPYSLVLYAAKIPPQQFLNTVVWVNPRVEFRHPIRFDRFATGVPHSLNPGEVGVFTKNEVNNTMRSNASKITEFGNYVVIEN
jgi:hypothetical protein